MMKNNIIEQKSKRFALRIIDLYKFLTEEKKEYILSKQLLRSATSIGANVRESKRAQSIPDFYSKLNIALKEAEETLYWLELLSESGYVEAEIIEPCYKDGEEIVKILVSITKNQEK